MLNSAAKIVKHPRPLRIVAPGHQQTGLPMSELDYLTQQAMRGRMSRREFLGRAAAAGATAAMLAGAVGVLDAHAARRRSRAAR